MSDNTFPPGLAERLRAEFPDLRNADLEPESVRLLGKGIASTAYAFSVPPEPGAGPSSDPSSEGSGAGKPCRDWVVRLCNDYPEPWTWRGGRRFEVPLLTALAAAGLPVPGSCRALAGRDGLPVAIVERRVPGVPLEAPPVDSPVRLARDVAAFLGGLHGFSGGRARALGVPETDPLAESRQALASSAAHDWLDATTAGWLEARIGELERSRPGLPSTLIHGDFRPDHCFVESGRLVGVIDFGDTTIGDPARDFARLPDVAGERFAGLVLEEYARVDPNARGWGRRIAMYRCLDPLFELAEADEVEHWDRGEALETLRQRVAVARNYAG